MPDDPSNPNEPPNQADHDALADTSPVPNDDALSDAIGDLDPDAPSAAVPREPSAILCPYCGHTQFQRDASGKAVNKCSVCGGLFEPLSRKATQIAMGPWFLRDQHNPFRPGCSFEVVLRLLEQGKVGPTTVIRGPTTRQFWSIARNVPGLAHRLGFCHACRGRVETGLKRCPLCDAEFRDPDLRNELGLMYPNRRAAEAAQRSLDRQLALLQGKDIVGFDASGDPVEHHPEPSPPTSTPPPITPPEPDDEDDTGDLLDDALGVVTPRPDEVDTGEGASATVPPTRPAVLDFTPDDATQASPTTGAAPIAPPLSAPLQPAAPPPLSHGQPSRPWVIVLLITLNVLVALGILAYFLLRRVST